MPRARAQSTTSADDQGLPDRLRRFIFTLNNYTAQEEVDIAASAEVNKFAWMVYGHEIAPTTGTPHLQGAVVLSKQTRFNTVRSWPGFERMSIRVMRGTPQENYVYCTKEATNVVEFGSIPQPGKRSDLDAIARSVQVGESNLAIFESAPGTYLRYQKQIQSLRALFKPPAVAIKVHLLYGPPRTGKTRQCYTNFPNLWAIPLGKSLWFDNYQQEPDVLLDDFSGQITLTDCLRLFDRYPVQVPVKGGFVWWAPSNLMITTNVHPSQWYDYTSRQDSWEALTERFEDVTLFMKDLPPVIIPHEAVREWFRYSTPTNNRYPQLNQEIDIRRADNIISKRAELQITEEVDSDLDNL